MKKIQKLCFLALLGLMVGTSCGKKTQAPDPNPQDKCIEGIVIAEARGANLDPNMGYNCMTVVQVKNRSIGVRWRNYNNCVVIRNLSGNLSKLNQQIYFEGFSEQSSCGFFVTDCFAPLDNMCIIATNISTKCEAK